MPLRIALQMPNLSPLLGGLEGVDETTLQFWVMGAPELAQIEQFNVTKRTLDRAKDTGALADSVTYALGQGRPVLATIYYAAGPQVRQWERVYAPYQEGPPEGLATYTNPPRHMLYDAQTEDTDQIEQWATEWGDRAAEYVAQSYDLSSLLPE